MGLQQLPGAIVTRNGFRMLNLAVKRHLARQVSYWDGLNGQYYIDQMLALVPDISAQQ